MTNISATTCSNCETTDSPTRISPLLMSARNPRIRLTESGQDKVDTKDLADEIAAHLGDEHGEADHDVTPDTSQEDLMPLQCAPGSRGVGDKVLDGTCGQARVLDKDRTEEERSGEVSPDYRRPSYRGQSRDSV